MNVGTLTAMVSEKRQMRSTHKRDSSDAPLRGGLTRKSEECPVMGQEQRGRTGTGDGQQQEDWKNAQNQAKTFAITRLEVERAWQRVRAKGGVGGVDGESIKSFEQKLERNLYKLWNRMASGSYHPKAVKRVEIPKGDGKKRPLGIPTIEDRVAQEVVKARFEPIVEKFFHRESYGYRPNRSATEAVGKCRERCWKYDWVLDVDIQKFFDTIDHTLMLKAVEKYSPEGWMTLYIKRWLKAPVQHLDGRVADNQQGTPQGGVISPLLANLYLHFAFDAWMERTFPDAVFERYADDIVIHCHTLQRTEEVRNALENRMKECGLTLHPEKTKVVYCRDDSRKGRYPTKKFTFLGYTFQPRWARTRNGKRVFTSFLPAVGTQAAKRFRDGLKDKGILRMHHLSLAQLTGELNPRIRGWYQYFARFYRSALNRMNDWLDMCIVSWLRAKHRLTWKASYRLLADLARRAPQLLAHWAYRLPGRAV